jgi:hypothetical protein
MESMIGLDLVGLSVPLLILVLGAYVVAQARRSRESELTYKLRKSQIALHDAEQALDNTIRYYKAEISRLRAQLGEEERPPPSGNGAHDAGDAKFRQAKKSFARLFHPDHFAGDTPEKRIRTELFKEFWEELDRIERR